MEKAKFGSRGDTTLRLPMSTRDRLDVVATMDRMTMKDWILKKVEEVEKEKGIVQKL